MERRGPVIVYGLPSANYTRGAVCTGVAHCSAASLPPSSKTPPSARVSSEPLRLWGLSQIALEPGALPITGGKRPGFLMGSVKPAQTAAEGLAPTSKRLYLDQQPKCCWPWWESSHHPLDTSLRGQRHRHWSQTVDIQTQIPTQFPKFLESLNKGRKAFSNVEGRTPAEIWGKLGYRQFLYLMSLTNLVTLLVEEQKHEFCITRFVPTFTTGKPKGWKEERTQFHEKGIFWCVLIFSRGK